MNFLHQLIVDLGHIFCKNHLTSHNFFQLTKRNVQAMDLLTLDQIINVSDKVLVTLFGELTGDEMKRHYKYKCQILPDDCEEIFSSFGNESRAKSQLLEHLRNHIKTLKSKSKG